MHRGQAHRWYSGCRVSRSDVIGDRRSRSPVRAAKISGWGKGIIHRRRLLLTVTLVYTSRFYVQVSPSIERPTASCSKAIQTLPSPLSSVPRPWPQRQPARAPARTVCTCRTTRSSGQRSRSSGCTTCPQRTLGSWSRLSGTCLPRHSRISQTDRSASIASVTGPES